MKLRIIIEDYEKLAGQDHTEAAAKQGKSEVWSGDVEILREGVYITKISLLADGEPQPICDVPFSMSKGFYMWVPGSGPQDDDSVYYQAPGQVVETDIRSAYPLELTEGLGNMKEGDE